MIRWQEVNGIYQIYPRSFKDSNGDGIGDIPGIIDKLDHIKGAEDSLGIDAIWLSPFYTSPMADFGYDVSNYTDVDPIFGTLDDFKRLVDEAHTRDIKVMVDYVPNHTSDEHPWFEASRSSRDNDKRSWYVWRDPKPDGSPPNNWLSVFGGSAWEYDETTGQYYLHSFVAKQPDLNWDNPAVRSAMMDVLRFWLSLGVDGIRADAVRWISKDADLQDNPINPKYREGEDPYHAQLQRYSRYGSKLFAYLKEMADVVEEYPDGIILFEDYLDQYMDKREQYCNFYAVNPRIAAPFNFDGMSMPYSASAFRKYIDDFQKIIGNELRPFYCFSNHDQMRLATRFGASQARLIALLQLTLPGIPVIYYGDEIGMRNVEIPPEMVHDPFEKLTPGLGLGRDPERTPMQWTSDAHAGFSTHTTWLPVSKDYAVNNVQSENLDEHSPLSYYRKLLALRRSSAIQVGIYEEWAGSSDNVFGYIRRGEHDALLILLNMSDNEITCHDVEGEVLYSTHDAIEMQHGERSSIVLQEHQGIVVQLLSIETPVGGHRDADKLLAN